MSSNVTNTKISTDLNGTQKPNEISDKIEEQTKIELLIPDEKGLPVDKENETNDQDVIEIESSDDESCDERVERLKRKVAMLQQQPKRLKILKSDPYRLENHEKIDLLLANKPLAIGEFGFKFMDDESNSNSNSKDSSRSIGIKSSNLTENSNGGGRISGGSSNNSPNFFYTKESSSDQDKKLTFTCHICQKEVVSRYNLKRHMMIHNNGEKIFKFSVT